MVIIFHKSKDISDKELMKIGITSMRQNIYFMGKWNIDSNEKYLLLYKFIMNGFIVPVSWKYFLNFIIGLSLVFKNQS